MKPLYAIAALVFAFTPIAAPAADYPAPKQGDWVARDFKFHTGETMPELKIHFTTVGEPSGQPVLVLHGTGGAAASMLTPAFAGALPDTVAQTLNFECGDWSPLYASYCFCRCNEPTEKLALAMLSSSGSIFVVPVVPPSFADRRRQLSLAPMTRLAVLHFDDGLNGTRWRAGVAGGCV